MTVSDRTLGGGGIDAASLGANSDHPLVKIFPLHNPTVCERLNREWLKNCSLDSMLNPPLDDIAEYFNDSIALYFAFMRHYVWWLLYFIVPAAVAQVGAFIVGKPSYSGIETAVVFMIFWSVCFVDAWKRQE